MPRTCNGIVCESSLALVVATYLIGPEHDHAIELAVLCLVNSHSNETPLIMTIVETTLMHGLLYDLPDFRDAEFLATEDTALMRQPVAHPC